jgi:ABC-type transporter Mla subunit MlaD
MKRIATVALLLSLAAAVVLTTGAGGGGSYKVRAIFDNAGFVIPGEDVKVAGVKVGKIDSMDVTRDFKAVLVLDIQDPAYQDFRTDARCQVRPQSLIGERFVECTPTQKRAIDSKPPPELRQIKRGEGQGQYLLPVTNTEKSVDLDLINNIMRLPYRDRLSLILSELGTGLAGRGTEINQVVRRADPALREVDEVLKLLASQNKVLADLARDSDTTLAPLARERRHISSFIRHSSSVAQATAERGNALEADIEKLPPFLAELKPTMRRLGALADQATPVFQDLGGSATDINRMIIALGPFSTAGIPAVKSLGDASVIGTPAVRAALPVTKDLRQLAAITKPVAATASAVLLSFKKGQGVQRLLDYVFYQVAAVNGFDKFGHYLRTNILVSSCIEYFTFPFADCVANFKGGGGSGRQAFDPQQILKRFDRANSKSGGTLSPPSLNDTGATHGLSPLQPAPIAPSGQGRSQSQAQLDGGVGVLDYLLGP